MGKHLQGFRWARPSRGLSFFVALVLFSVVVGVSFLDLLGVKQTLTSPKADEVPERLSVALPPQGRMLVVLIDSLRKDSMFSDHMPFLSGLRERGAWGSSHVASIPITISGGKAIFSGIIADPLAFFENFQPLPSTMKNLFMFVTQRGGRVIIFDGSLRRAYGQYTDLTAFQPRKFLFSEFREEARYVFQQSHKFLSKEPWDLAVVPFYAIDYVGHLNTPRSSEYLALLPVIDDYVRQLVELTTERDVVLITAEHGMDSNGFHVDRDPQVIETPFILLGPRVRPGGPRDVLQIDWAPTLSLLAGVSPFYDSLALPALDLLDLHDEKKAMLLELFSRALTGTSGSPTLEELRERRLDHLQHKGSASKSSLAVVGTLLSMAFFAYVALAGGEERLKVKPALKLIGIGLLAIFSVVGLIFSTGVLNVFTQHIPFSANFIFSNPFKVALVFGLLALLPLLSFRLAGGMRTTTEARLLLLLSAIVLMAVYVADNPYHPLSWLFVTFPLIGWGITQRPEWAVIFFSAWVGLAIRRLTFYNVYTPLIQPDRWVLAAAVLAVGLALLWWRVRQNDGKTRLIGLGLLLFLPGVATIAWPSHVETNTLLLTLLLVPVLVASSREPTARGVWLALWVVLFFLGTSSDINHMTHLVVLPMFLAVWVAARRTSAVAVGLIVSWVIWSMYLLPGNGFDFKLRDISDPFLISSAQTEQIEFTVMVIMSRYILPTGILLWGIKEMNSRFSLLSVVSTSLVPVVGGIGIRLMILQSTTSVGLPWDQLSRLAVLLGYTLALLGGFALVAFITSLGKLFRYQAP